MPKMFENPFFFGGGGGGKGEIPALSCKKCRREWKLIYVTLLPGLLSFGYKSLQNVNIEQNNYNLMPFRSGSWVGGGGGGSGNLVMMANNWPS